eukprot:6174091-Pleurochrysis_carterae.AAC.1
MSGGMDRVDLLARASSTILGRDLDASVRDLCKESGKPSGKYVVTRCEMYFSCFRMTQDSSAEMSTFRRFDTGPSSSTFQRCVSASTRSLYSEPGPSCE